MSLIFALDLGTAQTGWVLLDDARVIDCGVKPNENMLDHVGLVQPHNGMRLACGSRFLTVCALTAVLLWLRAVWMTCWRR